MVLGSDLSSPEMWVRGMGSWAGPDEPKDLSSNLFQPSGIEDEAEDKQEDQRGLGLQGLWEDMTGSRWLGG